MTAASSGHHYGPRGHGHEHSHHLAAAGTAQSRQDPDGADQVMIECGTPVATRPCAPLLAGRVQHLDVPVPVPGGSWSGLAGGGEA